MVLTSSERGIVGYGVLFTIDFLIVLSERLCEHKPF